ncbi:MAG: hypothetical protein LBC86_03915 [Oscillospiraceae bacterium]|nr:hypothetical protein [Oscillospiraceae bacterium]
MSTSYVKQIEEIFKSIFDTKKHPIKEGQYYIQDLGVPHRSKTLPQGKMAIYTFVHNGQFLKIGKVGKNSNARFSSQHYNPGSAMSTLSKSILRDPSMKNHGLNHANIKPWMKQNLHRIDIIIDAGLGNEFLARIEDVMHYMFNPKYEGGKIQNCANHHTTSPFSRL